MSRLIPLTQGQSTVVDDCDYLWLSQWKWTAQKHSRGFYAIRRDRGRLVMMHRLINNTPPQMVTDHRDGNGLNNQRTNLRNASQLQNMMNRKGKRGGSSRFKGVWLDQSPRNRKSWRSAIRLNGKLQYLGRFSSEEEAAAAYANAARSNFGDFSNISQGSSI